ncbi:MULTISPECIES: helix-turn-helix transcriptional regulator [unclassified Rhodococcus (in: high G+C Gram-positive bacteria)]|jgi:transcriptional regulator with XRE-family HTH domain|uniref:helix-turn-helix domain-containing protein n=1 Tax=unclassified Rhodococcus (in: high G+C Gram-positive bacteria) TaxID=192944 RepID=UPI0031407081
MSEELMPPVHIPEWDQGDRMRKALKSAQMTTTAMAEYLGITRETAGRYMSGSARVPLQTLRLWSLRCGVPLEWLTDGIVPDELAQ